MIIKTITPKVTIVIPVYNGEKYLYSCLNSLSAQSLKDIEIICVDDGSTDGSFDILQSYVQKDNRFVVLQQNNQGAACARNLGLSIAKGEYILFLDSDDTFDRMLCEKTYHKAQTYNADITIFKALSFNTNNNKKIALNDCLHKFKQFQTQEFSVYDIPNDIFNSFLVQALNKLFKREFILKHKIIFQNLRRTNDLLFTSKALLKAERIILLDEFLLYYRVGQSGNLQSGNDKTPLEFYQALAELKEFLEKHQLYNLVEKSYIKLWTEITLYNYNSVKTSSARNLILKKIRAQINNEHLNKLKRLSFTTYLQYKYLMFNNNYAVSKTLYAIHKVWQYYKLTGIRNAIKKIILKW